MAIDFSKPVWVRWKQAYYIGTLVRRTNHGKSFLVKLANGLLVQVKAARLFQ